MSPNGARVQLCAKMKKLGARLGRVPLIGPLCRKAQTRIFWKMYAHNVCNINLLYRCAYGLADGFINGSLSPHDMQEAAARATVMNVVGLGPLYAWGHKKTMDFFGITPKSSLGKTVAANVAFAIPSGIAWNMIAYAHVDPNLYWRSVLMCLLPESALTMLVMPANSILNHMATNKGKYLRAIPENLSKALGCNTLTPAAKKLRYYGALGLLVAGTATSWYAGPPIHKAIVDMLTHTPAITLSAAAIPAPAPVR